MLQYILAKKKRVEDKSKLNTKLAFVNGHVKAPLSIQRKQEKVN
jgi:hypothetical protein